MLNKYISLSIEQRDNGEYILAIGQRLAVNFRGCCRYTVDENCHHHSERLDKQRNEKHCPPDLQLGASGSETSRR